MKTKIINIEDALNKDFLKSLGLEYALIYNFDGVIVDFLDEVKIDKRKLLEARFFNEKEEVHIFKECDLKSVYMIEDGDKYSDEKYILANKYGKGMTVRNYFSFDDDGQAYISYTRPISIVL
jgi:hypothetical protein